MLSACSGPRCETSAVRAVCQATAAVTHGTPAKATIAAARWRDLQNTSLKLVNNAAANVAKNARQKDRTEFCLVDHLHSRRPSRYRSTPGCEHPRVWLACRSTARLPAKARLWRRPSPKSASPGQSAQSVRVRCSAHPACTWMSRRTGSSRSRVGGGVGQTLLMRMKSADGVNRRALRCGAAALWQHRRGGLSSPSGGGLWARCIAQEAAGASGGPTQRATLPRSSPRAVWALK
jgi:hypothetical protein